MFRYRLRLTPEQETAAGHRRRPVGSKVSKGGSCKGVRTAYRCRAYPDEDQQAMLARTFGCVRVVWNRTLAARNRASPFVR
jgi:hypothetical protein